MSYSFSFWKAAYKKHMDRAAGNTRYIQQATGGTVGCLQSRKGNEIRFFPWIKFFLPCNMGAVL